MHVMSESNFYSPKRYRVWGRDTFDKLLIESVELVKAKKRLMRENKELTEKSKSLKNTISQIQLNPHMKKD